MGSWFGGQRLAWRGTREGGRELFVSELKKMRRDEVAVTLAVGTGELVLEWMDCMILSDVDRKTSPTEIKRSLQRVKQTSSIKELYEANPVCY